MKKAIASGLVGLIALGGAISVAPSDVSAQEIEESTSRQERQHARRAQCLCTSLVSFDGGARATGFKRQWPIDLQPGHS